MYLQCQYVCVIEEASYSILDDLIGSCSSSGSNCHQCYICDMIDHNILIHRLFSFFLTCRVRRLIGYAQGGYMAIYPPWRYGSL